MAPRCGARQGYAPADGSLSQGCRSNRHGAASGGAKTATAADTTLLPQGLWRWRRTGRAAERNANGGIRGRSWGHGRREDENKEATTESQNHRIVGVGRDLCGSSSPTPLPKQGHLQQAKRTMFSSNGGESHTFLGPSFSRPLEQECLGEHSDLREHC